MPTITAVRPILRSKKLDDLRSWHVGYQFCGISAEITVYAIDEAQARAKAADQLRARGLKWPNPPRMGATTIWPLARTARGIGASLHRDR